MSFKKSQTAGLKEKAINELAELGGLFLYLAFFFCAVATYRMLLLNDFRAMYFPYGTALIDAFAIAKVILIGEFAHLGKKHETRPLLDSAIYKAFLFGLLVFGFHSVEETLKVLLRGKNMANALHQVRMDDLLARSVVVFVTFVPLFAFRELRRVLGTDKFRALFFHAGEHRDCGR